MTERDVMQNLAETTAEMSEKMSIEQMRLFQVYVTKTLEAKEAEEAFRAAADLEGRSDQRVAERIRGIRAVLEDKRVRLSGTESVLLAGQVKALEGEDYTDTKRINILLTMYDRKPSNTTKIVDTLEKKQLMEIQSDGLHAHKTFRLTSLGEAQAEGLMSRLEREDCGDRLAVVD